MSQDLQQLIVACSEVLSIAYLCSSRTAAKQARTAQCKPVCVHPTLADRQLQLAWQPVLFCAADQPGPATGTADTGVVTSKPAATDSPKQAAEKLVWSFLVLFENLVSARTLLKSLQEASLLVAPLPGQPAIMKGQEVTAAEAFVKKLQVRLSKGLVWLSVV